MYTDRIADVFVPLDMDQKYYVLRGLFIIGFSSCVYWPLKQKLQNWVYNFLVKTRFFLTSRYKEICTLNDHHSTEYVAKYSLVDSSVSCYASIPSKLVICFGSQTGTAEGFSRKLKRELINNVNIPVDVLDFDEINPENLLSNQSGENLTIWWVFCISTYGEGEPPDNARRIFKWISNKKREFNCLSELRYGIIGLGNRQYALFNHAAITFEKHLKRLGAIPFCLSGEADDDNDLEADCDHWVKKHLLPSLSSVETIKTETENDSTTLLNSLPYMECARTCDIIESQNFSVKSKIYTIPERRLFRLSERELFDFSPVQMIENRELRQLPDISNGLTTRHIVFDISSSIESAISYSLKRKVPSVLLPLTFSTTLSSNAYKTLSTLKAPKINYTTGNTVHILPPNPTNLVEWIFNRLTTSPLAHNGNSVKHSEACAQMKLSMNSIITLRSLNNTVADRLPPFPLPSSIGFILNYFCDLSGSPSREVLQNLSVFIEDLQERKRLLLLLDIANKEDFKRYITKPKLNIKDMLELFFTSANFSLSTETVIAAIMSLPHKKSRPYTACSSSVENKHLVAITVAKLTDNKDIPDFCTLRENLIKDKYIQQEKSMEHDVDLRHRKFEGCCSTFLSAFSESLTFDTQEPIDKSMQHPIESNNYAFIRITSSPFYVPSYEEPLIMIATGTGIAPFRAIWREFAFTSQYISTNSSQINSRLAWKLPPALVLFYGCTNSSVDFLYKEEIEVMCQDKHDILINGALETKPRIISHFFGAFSRMQQQKVYVQDVLLQHAELIRELIDMNKGRLFICGSTHMGKDVNVALQDIFGKTVYSLLKKKRIVEEIW